MHYWNPLSWFPSDVLLNRLWKIAFVVGIACEGMLYYETISCTQSTNGIGGIFCYILLFPGLPILLILSEITLHAISITTITTVPATLLILLQALSLIINALCIALVVFSVLRLIRFLIRNMLGTDSS